MQQLTRKVLSLMAAARSAIRSCKGFFQAGLENPQLKEVRKSDGLLLFRALSSGSLVIVPGVSHRRASAASSLQTRLPSEGQPPLVLSALSALPDTLLQCVASLVLAPLLQLLVEVRVEVQQQGSARELAQLVRRVSRGLRGRALQCSEGKPVRPLAEGALGL